MLKQHSVIRKYENHVIQYKNIQTFV